MRVKFTRDYPGGKGEESYTKGQVIHLDQGVADQVIAAGYAKEFPLTEKEVAEQATKYYAGDDKRTPAQIKDRVPQVVLLQGDTRTATEEQRGNDDPHEVRKEDEQIAEDAAEVKLKKMREATEAETPATPTAPASREGIATRRQADEEARSKAEGDARTATRKTTDK